MKIVVDMNLEPAWVGALNSAGHEASHWREHGSGTESDEEILAWAAGANAVILTQDLDFGSLLASMRVHRPSVVLVRTRNARPMRSASDILWALERFELELLEGALLVIDPDSHRVRRLPLQTR